MKKTMLALALSLGMVGTLSAGIGMMITSAPTVAYAQAAQPPAAPAAPAVAAPVVAAPAAPAAPAAEVAPAPVEECGISCVMTNVQKVFTDWKALGWQAGLMALLVLLISTFKNSILRKWLWDWMGEAKAVVPYVLSLLVVLLSIPKDQWGLATILMALTTGGGAVALHQLLDALKSAPWIGQKIVWVIELLAKVLKKPAA